LKSALEAANRLQERGLEVAVYSCPVLSAEPPANFAPLWQHPTVLAVEEHGAAGGFGSFLKELAPSGVRVQICAIGKETFSLVGSQAFLRQQAGLDGEGLAEMASRLV
jgi:transketolase C-terminal domain/subunit